MSEHFPGTDRRQALSRARRGEAALAVLVTIGFLAAMPPPVLAQSAPADRSALRGEERLLLQEIPSVYSASKYEQKVTEAPSSVSIVTGDEIKRFGYRTLADILRSVTGFYTSYDRNYTYLGVPGKPAGTILSVR